MIKGIIQSIRESFFIKFFLTFTGITLLMISLLVFFFIRHQSLVLWNNLIHHGQLVTDMLAYNSRLGVFAENRELLEDVVNGALKQESVETVFVYNPTFEKLMTKSNVAREEAEIHRQPVPDDRNSASHFMETKNKIEFWSPVFSRSRYLEKSSLFLEEAPRSDLQNPIGYVQVIVSKNILNEQRQMLFVNSMVMGVIFWVFGSGILFMIVKSITQPLNRLTWMVNRMGRTGNIRKLQFAVKDEIGKLADAFNSMSDSVKQREMEKSRLEEQLRQAQKMEAIGTLAGGIAHDFNNILGAIHGFTELGLLEVQKETVIYEKLKEIEVAANRAADLVKQILTFSRQSEEIQDPLSVGTIIKEVLKLLHPSIPPGIRVEQQIDPECGLVLSNATAIHQILMNLFNNALHAMKEKGGVLKIKMADVDIASDQQAAKAGHFSGMYQKLTVEDSGYGISSEIRERIFDPFFTTKKEGEGTGMGLSVVHGIVNRQKGFLAVESARGKGSAFHVYIPLVDLKEIPEVPATEEDSPMGKGRILLVDDDPQLLESTAGMLESLGYDVVKKTDAGNALAYIKQDAHDIDLVLTDMAMPVFSGVHLASEIHRIKPGMPILLTTGYSEMIDAEKACSMGFKGFLLKPIKRKTLAVTIKNLLGNAD